MKHTINKIIQFFAKLTSKKKTHKPLTNETLRQALSENDFYQVCIKSKNNNIVAKAISYFSGPYSHTVIVYHGQWWNWKFIWIRLYSFLEDYYTPEFILSETPENIVLASSDADGHNFFDISVYQNREMEIYKLNVPQEKHEKILLDFLKQSDKPYDSTGLVGQIFKPIKYIGKFIYRLFDDERADYCSEGNQDIMSRHGRPLADNDNPTPTEIHEYCEKYYKKVYDSIKIKI